MSDPTIGLAQSVQVRLVRHAKAIGVDPNLILTRFAVERFLYRLSRSTHADRFVLKGALMLVVWLGEAIRPTRDADLLGFGDLPDAALRDIVRDVCGVDVESDGLTYDKDSVQVALIRPEDAYGGTRITLQARLGPARLRVQVDVGLGDAVVPEPVLIDYPGLLDFPRARLRAYRPETTIAEKVHAMVTLGSKNSRMRDFFDIDALAERHPFEGQTLTAALDATFKRRGTPVPSDVPMALTPEFARLSEKQAQWAGFLKRNRLSHAPSDLGQVVERLSRFLEPVIDATRRGAGFERTWEPGGPWRNIQPPSDQSAASDRRIDR
jgi:predicted nucleotidyltransferase component of viral defense system